MHALRSKSHRWQPGFKSNFFVFKKVNKKHEFSGLPLNDPQSYTLHLYPIEWGKGIKHVIFTSLIQPGGGGLYKFV